MQQRIIFEHCPGTVARPCILAPRPFLNAAAKQQSTQRQIRQSRGSVVRAAAEAAPREEVEPEPLQEVRTNA